MGKYHQKMTAGLLTATLAAIGFTNGSADAATIVNFGGDYVSTTTSITNTGGYSAGTFLTISPSSGYTGPVFAGQLSAAGSLTTSAIVQGSTANDPIRIKFAGTTLGSGLVIFQKDHFENGGDTQVVSFDSTSTIAIDVLKNVVHDNYLVIKAGGSYYMSGPITSGDIGTATTLSFNPTSLTWYTYDPTHFDTVSTTVAADLIQDGVIADIQAVGVLSKRNGTAADNFSFTGFTVETTAVPEGASLGILSAAGLLLAGRRRR